MKLKNQLRIRFGTIAIGVIAVAVGLWIGCGAADDSQASQPSSAAGSNGPLRGDPPKGSSGPPPRNRPARNAFRTEDTARFKEHTQDFLIAHCSDCHLDGESEGNFQLDDLLVAEKTIHQQHQWERVLDQLQTGLMPPADQDRPTAQSVERLNDWVKDTVFRIDPNAPDPGHVTLRRLNRVEYQNTIRDLMGYRIDASVLFPPDDTGEGFDNIGEVLSTSPLLMEKYINAATEVVLAKVPLTSAIPRTHWISIKNCRIVRGEVTEQKLASAKSRDPKFSLQEGGQLNTELKFPHDGRYRLELILRAYESYRPEVGDKNRCRVTAICGDQVIVDEIFGRSGYQKFTFETESDWQAQTYPVEIKVVPLEKNEPSPLKIGIRVEAMKVIGPLDRPEHFIPPPNYRRFFGKPFPKQKKQYRSHAYKILQRMAKKALRRPAESETVMRLVDLAESVWKQPNATPEQGVAQAMIAILSSPSFVFRETFPMPTGITPPANPPRDKAASGVKYPLVDEYTLASRLSYFLWSTMPDNRLIKLADQGDLRKNLDAEIKRMVADDRFQAFYQNFVGQWLRTRDVEGVNVDSAAVLNRAGEINQGDYYRLSLKIDKLRREKAKTGKLSAEQQKQLTQVKNERKQLIEKVRQFEMNTDLRRSMRKETELLVKHIIDHDSDFAVLLNADFTFLNERLAKHYGIAGVKGRGLRRVKLSPDQHRGGILTHGSLLTVTSNPDRTSPVKRGLFVLDNILGMPIGSPPPDIPALEDAHEKKDGQLTLRQSLAKHRDDVKCKSCHDRMDPLGLALENFDALGRFRERERETKIDASGVLATGESFQNYQDLQILLVKKHKDKFYRCLTRKMMTFALGRSLEYYDRHTIDDITNKLLTGGGKPSILIREIVASPAFQRTRTR